MYPGLVLSRNRDTDVKIIVVKEEYFYYNHGLEALRALQSNHPPKYGGCPVTPEPCRALSVL